MDPQLQPYFDAINAARTNVTSVAAEVAAAQAVLDAANAKAVAANQQLAECKTALVNAVNTVYGS